MRVEDRDPSAGRGDPELVAGAEDLPRLGHHLALLGRVVVALLERLDLRQHVERDLVRIDVSLDRVAGKDRR